MLKPNDSALSIIIFVPLPKCVSGRVVTPISPSISLKSSSRSIPIFLRYFWQVLTAFPAVTVVVPPIQLVCEISTPTSAIS